MTNNEIEEIRLKASKLNKKQTLKYVAQDGLRLEFIPDKFKDDEDIVLEAIYSKGSIKFASERLKNDKKIILTAVNYNLSGEEISFASNELRNDKNFILDVVSINGWALQYMPEHFKNDKEVVLTAIYYCGTSLQYASDELKNDRDIVISAVKKYGDLLQHASLELRNDKEIVLIATEYDFTGKAISFASNELQNDKNFILEVLSINALQIRSIPEQFKYNKEFLIPAIIKDCYSLLCLPEELQNNKKLVNLAISNDKTREGIFLSKISYKFQNDYDIVLTAINKNPQSYQFASDRLKCDLDILLILKFQTLDNTRILSMGWHQEAMKKLDILLEENFLEDSTPVNSRINKPSVKF